MRLLQKKVRLSDGVKPCLHERFVAHLSAANLTAVDARHDRRSVTLTGQLQVT